MLSILLQMTFIVTILCGLGLKIRTMANINGKAHWSTAALFGLLPLSLLSQIYYIFSPLNLIFYSLILALGLYFFVRHRKSLRVVSTLEAVSTIVLAIFISAYALDHYFYFDSANYHLSMIQWLKTENLTVGLANIHDRFGANTLWYFISAAAIPYLNPSTYIDIGSLALILIFICFSLFSLKNKTIPIGYLTIFFSSVWLQEVLFKGLGWPSPDIPSTLLAALFFVVWLDITITDSLDRESLSLLALLGLICIMIRLSYIPIGLGLGYMLLEQRRKKIALFNSFYIPLLLCLALWATYGFLLSGCWVFPEALTCFPSAPWTLPQDKVIEISRWVKSWARQYPESPNIVLADWKWLTFWIKNYFLRPPLILATLLFVVFALSLIVSAAARSYAYKIRYILAVIFIGFSFWFFTAPDPRFAAGLWMAASVLTIAPLAQKMFKRFSIAPRILTGILGLIALFLFADVSRYMISKYPLIASRFNASDFPITRRLNSTFEVEYLQPDPQHEAPACWFAQQPCTPYESPNLNRQKWGPFLMYKTGP